MQSYLVVLADGGRPDAPSMQEPDLPAFLASLSSAWRAGEVRPTHSEEAQPRYLRPLREVVAPATVTKRQLAPPQWESGSQRDKRIVVTPVRPSMPQLDVEIERRCELQRQDLATRHVRRIHAFTLVWPVIERRLEGRPNLNASELFDELRAQYPGRFHLGQLAALTRRVNLWRKDARARGAVIGKRSNRTSGLPRTWRTRVDPFDAQWPELCEWLGKDPDQTGLELFAKLRSKYPDCYTAGQLRTLQRRLKCWRREAVKRLICEMQDFTQDVGVGTG